MKIRRTSWIFWLLLGLSSPTIAQAVDPPAQTASISLEEADRRVSRLADELRSPFCPGKTLMTCTSSQAYDLRKEMHAMALQGLNDTEIVTELKIRYGDDVSNPPQPWYTFFVPFMPYVLGGLLLLLVIRQWLGKGQKDEAAPVAEQSEADAERLAELRARVSSLDDF